MILIIYNPKAGLKDQGSINTIIKHMNQQNISFDIYITEVDFGPREILKSVKQEYDAYVVAGGDGTVSQLVQGLYECGINKPILILPKGTANELAKNYESPNDLDEVLEDIHALVPENYDLGIVNEQQTFTFALTFGNFTQVTYETPQKLKNWMGYRAYILYGMFSFRRIHAYNLTVKADDVDIKGEFVYAGITNAHSVGGVFGYNEDQIDLSDGKAELMLIRKPKTLKDVNVLIKALNSHKYDGHLFTIVKASSFEITSDKQFALNVDGEFGGDHKLINVEIRQCGLHLLVPKQNYID